MSKRNRFIKVMTKMSFYFRKLPSNAPVQDSPLISICPFHLKPSVQCGERESTWTMETSRQGGKLLPQPSSASFYLFVSVCLTFFSTSLFIYLLLSFGFYISENAKWVKRNSGALKNKTWAQCEVITLQWESWWLCAVCGDGCFEACRHGFTLVACFEMFMFWFCNMTLFLMNKVLFL